VPFQISYTEVAFRALCSMPGRYRQRVRRLIEALAIDPHHPRSKELRGLPERFRLRFNGWRVIYRVDEETNNLLILAVRHKSGPETYQKLE
jgi:mRNA-degrading endonuclease RelE of RelBE toxin-antitoxin system